jgi:hypothetical protein
MRTVKGGGIIVDGDTWDEVPVPGSSYIFIFIALEVCIDDAIGEVETKKLLGISAKIVTEDKDLTFSEFVHSVFRVLVEYILTEVT